MGGEECGGEVAYTGEDEISAPTSVATLANMGVPHRTRKVGSQTSSKSSPYIKRTNPNKILGDFHLTKLN